MNLSKNEEINFSDLRNKTEEKLIMGSKKRRMNSSLEKDDWQNVSIAELKAQNRELITKQSKLLNTIEEYTQLFDYAPASYFILNKNGVIINVNNTAIDQLATSKKQLLGSNLSSIFSAKSYRDEYYRHRNSVIETGDNKHFECEIKRFDRTVFYALIESSVVKDTKNNFKHFFLILSDISIQKDKEQKIAMALLKEKELNEMKSQFITIASHEFRTPLSTILTSSELIEKYNKPKDESKRENHFRKIRTSVQRLKEILMDFMSASEIERGKIKNNPESFNLIEVTENLIEEIVSYNGTHHVTYKHVGSYHTLFLDKIHLKAAMTNLLVNAYKYSPDGGLIEITTQQNKPGNLIISIKDQGIGIPENDKQYIFEKFYRAGNAETIQGTGLGLNITQRLITLMGGTVSFLSKENKGSIFYIKFEKNLTK